MGVKESKLYKKNRDKKDKANKDIKKDLDSDLVNSLDEADTHEQRFELLLTQIVRELKKGGK